MLLSSYFSGRAVHSNSLGALSIFKLKVSIYVLFAMASFGEMVFHLQRMCGGRFSASSGITHKKFSSQAGDNGELPEVSDPLAIEQLE